ncbi:MAG TPA: alpha/beta fold hydrolase [Candidatus Acidoferrales bacterium]|nr:alpha/beta fold hydrolase [Candidatus Acidoferrales bacterium]
MKKSFLLAALCLFLGGASQAQSIAGDWQGTLHAGSQDLRLILHITQSGDGALHATLDSIDQGANGIPVSSITFKDSKLSFTSDAVHGSYEGTADKDVTSINGTWTQSTPLPLNFERAKKHAEAKPSDIDGAWSGVLDAGATKLHIVFHIRNTDVGLTATMDSPDQGGFGIAASKVTRDGASLKIEWKNIGGAFDGKFDKALQTLDGTWSQGGGSAPLTLKRGKETSQIPERRPQDPVRPYPYKDEDVTFANSSASITLAGTITIPPGKGPFPAAIFIAGSGPHDRDETILGHRPFLVLSDYLTRKGILVLRYDKRGCAKSTGKYAAATTADFATDAEAAVAYLKTRPEVNPHEIGLIGHSEGGAIAPMVAAHDPIVAFVVMLAGPGVKGDELLVAQVEALNEANGATREQAEKNGAEERKILEAVEQSKSDADLEAALRADSPPGASDEAIHAQMKAINSPWFRYFLQYDPAPALRQLKCPVLALIGEKDRQVPPDQNLPAIRKALQEGGNKNFEVDELPGLNHLFQTAKTGSVGEYATISETIAPIALEKISAWILKATSSR